MTLLKMKRQKDSSEESSSSMSTTTNGVHHHHHNHHHNQTMMTTNMNVTYRELIVEEEFDIVKTLAEGCFARVILAKKNQEKMVLKAIHCEVTSNQDFSREMNFNYFLSPHQNIVTSFNVSFIWNNSFVYVQEYAPYGDLSRFVKKGGLPEAQVKLVAQQLSSAIEFVHSFRLVHRDLKLENILVFKPNLSRIKLCDFGQTRLEGTLVSKKTSQTWIPFAPPEICHVVNLERYYCHSSADVWQIGVILYVCLTGTSPWQCADITDAVYRQYTDWHRRKSLRMPEKFKPFTPRLVRLLKRLLEPKASKRSSVSEVPKYLKDDWIRKGCSNSNSVSPPSTGPTNVRGVDSTTSQLLERRESTSTAARHSSSHITNNNQQQPRHRLVTGSRGSYKGRSPSGSKTLQSYGLEIDVDKKLLSNRVIDWIESSAGSSSSNSSDSF